MTGTIKRKASPVLGLAAAALGLVLAAGWLVGACGTTDSQEGTDHVDASTVEQSSPPPIDLAAPGSFQTASFAFG